MRRGCSDGTAGTRGAAVPSSDSLGVGALARVFPAGVNRARRRGVVPGQQGLAAFDAATTLDAEVLEAIAADDPVMT